MKNKTKSSTKIKLKARGIKILVQYFVMGLFGIESKSPPYRNICVRCGHVVEQDELKNKIALFTCYGLMHRCCGDTISHEEKYGGKQMPKELELDKPWIDTLLW